MFAKRFTALIDACALAGALKRNLLLTSAEAQFFRIRWSDKILDETEAAIEAILRAKGAQARQDTRRAPATQWSQRSERRAWVTSRP